MELTPELVGSVFENAALYEIATTFFSLICFFFFIAILIEYLPSVLKKLCDPKGAKEYRNLLSDMYVVGMVKKLAKKDDVDLLVELKELDKISKKGKIELRSIDRVVEEELKQKLAKVTNEATTKSAPAKK